MEIWKDVVGYEGLYEVSNIGNVRTKDGKVTNTTRHGNRVWKQRYLKEKNKKGRDVRFDLWKDGKPKSFLAHRLVAFAFIPLEEGKNFINHKDGNPRNNNSDNLEWCNHKENNNHAFDNGLMPTAKKTTVKSLVTGEVITFRSMSKASEYLGKNKKYLSDIFIKQKKNVVEVDGYIIERL